MSSTWLTLYLIQAGIEQNQGHTTWYCSMFYKRFRHNMSSLSTDDIFTDIPEYSRSDDNQHRCHVRRCSKLWSIGTKELHFLRPVARNNRSLSFPLVGWQVRQVPPAIWKVACKPQTEQRVSLVTTWTLHTLMK